MTNEEKQLLLKDLCARLPYGVKCAGWMNINNDENINKVYPYIDGEYIDGITNNKIRIQGTWLKIEFVKPYLRPMSSMTDKEKDELRDIIYFGYPSDDYDEYGHRGVEIAYVEHDDWEKIKFDFDDFCSLENWLNIHHFDYRGLIEKGLVLEAPKEMY